ncbi:MAG: glycosyltransferase family 2 protein [Terrimicrobiaceae bacterium]
MNSTPRISVVMTVYNAGGFLIEAVGSILSQTFGDFEFVIVDDGSTDGSVEVLTDFSGRDQRIRLFCNPSNFGQTACLNQGLREARADWVARQDADDVSLPGRLERQWACVSEKCDTVLVGVNGWIMNEFSSVTGMIHVPVDDAAIRASMVFRNPFIHTGVLFRRVDPRGAVVQYDERYRICQDWELWSRLLDDGKVMNLPERLVGYRHHQASLSHASGEKTREESERVVSAIWDKSEAGRPIEKRLLESFREGLRVADRGDFWRFYGRNRPAAGEAVHRVQAAGALVGQDVMAAAGELFAAWRLAPGWTSDVLVRSAAIRLGLVGTLKTGSFDRGGRSSAG